MQTAELVDLTIMDEIRKAMLEKEESIAVGESVTSGLLQAAFSQSKDAMKFFQGGVTTYNLGQKYRHLNVDPIHAQSCNCVSDRVARDMALHVCHLFRSDWGIGITGFASPVPESGGKLFAWYAVAHKGEVVLDERIAPPEDEPLNVQLYYVQQILQKLRDRLKADAPAR